MKRVDELVVPEVKPAGGTASAEGGSYVFGYGDCKGPAVVSLVAE
jgi:hypothetical protein